MASFRGEPTVLGEVLCVQAHQRLSYVIRPPGASAVYLTWLLRRREEGCICRLHVDEPDTSDIAELEDVWLPIVAGLQRSVDALQVTASVASPTWAQRRVDLLNVAPAAVSVRSPRGTANVTEGPMAPDNGRWDPARRSGRLDS